MTTIRDRRAAAKTEPNQADVDRIERERLASRAALKDRVAHAEALRQRAGDAQEQFNEFVAQLDATVAEHDNATREIQAALSELDNRIAGFLRERKAIDPADEARRLVLLRELTAANTRLEETTRDIRRQRATREKAVGDLWRETHRLPREDDLCKPPYVNPELHVRMSVLRRSVNLASARVRHAQEQLQRVNAGWYGERLDRVRAEWEAELQTAEADLSAATAEAEAVRRAAIDE